MKNVLLSARELEVRYGAVLAVRGVSLEVCQGEIVALIGANGAGKSSILKALIGLNRPSAGTVVFQGQATESFPVHRKVARGLSLIPEGRRIFVDQTIDDNLRLGAVTQTHLSSAERAADRDRVYGLFPRLAERSKQMAGSLSGGEQQMLAIGRGLLSRPTLLMIDELSLGLAPKIVEQLIGVLRTLNQEGLTILLVEQMAVQALSVADRAYVLSNGKIVNQGAARELAQDPGIIANFLGKAHTPGHTPATVS